MAGDSFTGSRLSAITGTSSATAGAAERAFIIAVLDCGGAAAPGFPPSLAGASLPPFLPPLIDRNIGLPKIGLPFCIVLPGFALAALPAVLTDLLALAISYAPHCPCPGSQDYNVMRCRDTTARHPFCLLNQPVTALQNRYLRFRHRCVTKWRLSLDAPARQVKTPDPASNESPHKA